MTAIAEHKPQNVAAHDAPARNPVMEMIAQAVRDQQPMEVIRELKDMAKELAQDEAQREFNAAMGRAQSEMGRVAADAANTQTRSRYATYAALDKALRPIYTKHGFAISFDTGDGAPEGHVRVLGYVTHEAGFTRTYRADMPNDGKGAKGGDVMTKTHASGAAMSYGMRYLLKMIFNVAVGEDDTDGNTPSETITEDQVADIQALIDDVGGENAAKLKTELLAWAKRDRLADIPADKFNNVVQAINNRRQK